MPIIERDVVLQGVDEHGNQTMDLPITRLGNIEDTADTKDAPGLADYIPVIDMADSGGMKKMRVSALQKVVQPRSILLTLAAANWTGSSAPYAQTVSAADVQADEAKQLVQVAPAAASRAAWNAASALCTGQGAGTLTFETQEKPGADISVYVILQEVQA